MNIKEVVAQPRFHHQWRPDTLFVEEGGFDSSVVSDLGKLGHKLREREAYGGLNLVQIDGNSLMTAAADPRNSGSVAGY